MTSWRLADAAARAAANKYTFYKPGPSELSQIRTGENVKLIFMFESDDPAAPEAERMWVVVDSIDGEGGYTGRLDNEPRWIRDLKVGDDIAFHDIHIISTEHDDPNNLVEKYLVRCFVTNRILLDGQKVGYMYREEPDNHEDSGWRITAGDESEEYMDDAANISFVSLGVVLNRDDTMLALLDSPVGSRFERQSDSDRFQRVED